MANSAHQRILHEALANTDIALWNSWREGNPDIKPDLSGIKLTKVELFGIDFREADLSSANLSWSSLSGANLAKANLFRAQLHGTNLYQASLPRADLREAGLSAADLGLADLSGANLRGANLFHSSPRQAELMGADLAGANLAEANLIGADLSRAILIDANLSRSTLIGTILRGANLDGCRIYGISAWDLVMDDETSQKGLIISKNEESTITVDDLEVAQIVYLLVNHKKLRSVLNSITTRGVLILGRFGQDGLEVLQSVAAKLRVMGYLPIIFDFHRPADRNYTETVKTLVGLSRFVIADLSGPSVPQELYATVPQFKIPFVPILEEGRAAYALSVDILEYPWVIRPPVRFKSIEDLLQKMPGDVIAPAEEKLKQRQALMDQLFS